jgi:hypothetical protein
MYVLNQRYFATVIWLRTLSLISTVEIIPLVLPEFQSGIGWFTFTIGPTTETSFATVFHVFDVNTAA